ncbi:MAG: helicase-associated domain-containing protein [Phycisphaerae bacterium]|nr:helicase-associated domain-containing protein [Phycisphaerae bacterium]
MKLFDNDIDWPDFFKRMPTWDRLSPGTRRAFAEMKPKKPVKVHVFGDDVSRLVESGFVFPCTNSGTTKLRPDCQSFASIIRAMCRHDILDDSTSRAFCRYLEDHFTSAQRSALCPNWRYSYANDQILSRHAMSVGWLNNFLALESVKDARVWEKQRQEDYHGRGPYHRTRKLIFDKDDAFEAAQMVIRQSMTWISPVPFRELPDQFPRLPLPLLATAIFAGLRHLLLFPAMRWDDMTPVLTLWPTITQRLHRPKPPRPENVTPDQTFHGAFLMEDMTTVLIAATAQTLRLRSDDKELFAKARKELESSLMTVPEWGTTIAGCSTSCRLDAALNFLRDLHFIRTAGTAGRNLRIESAPESKSWLGMSGKDRLKYILDQIKPTKSPKPKGCQPPPNQVDDEQYYCSDGTPRPLFLPQTISWKINPNDNMSLSAALTRTYASLAHRQFVSLTKFVEYQAQQPNPLLKDVQSGNRMEIRLNWSWQHATEEDTEDLWSQFLVNFFRHRLLPLGCLQLGVVGKEKSACIALTDIGRYLFSLAGDFDYGHHHELQGQIVVQPNFEVVFLSPSPLAEVAIARFSERLSKGTGCLFKITRKSIFAAAGSGMPVAQVLNSLREVSAKALPGNVEHEIKSWFSQCKHIKMYPVTLIRCPDAKTATRVMAAGGQKITPISQTVFQLADHKSKTTLIKKLKGIGVFVVQAGEP